MKIRWYEILVLILTALCILLFLGNYIVTTQVPGIWITTERWSVSDRLTEASLTDEDGTLIDINTASQEELEALPGVGPVKAQAILEYRSINGPFQSKDELLKVDGIGEKLLEKISGLITVSTNH